MSALDLLLVAFFALLLAFTLGWNNSGVFTGNLSNMFPYSLALGITLLGMVTGYAAEGSKMSHSILGNLVTTPMTLVEVLTGVATSFFLFFTLTVTKIPVSLSNAVVGSFAGVAIASGALISSQTLIEIVASWILSPFLCAAAAIAVYELVTRLEKSLALTTLIWANRLALVGGVFYLSYVLGANNIGLIFSFVRANGAIQTDLIIVEAGLIYAAVAAGTVVFGKTIASVVSDKITGLSQTKTLAAITGAAVITWSLTQLSVPVSLTQVVIGGMLGAGAARAPAVVNGSELYVMIRDWAVVTLLCAALGFGVEFLLLRYY
jgi:phosphate/sulfate permease